MLGEIVIGIGMFYYIITTLIAVGIAIEEKTDKFGLILLGIALGWLLIPINIGVVLAKIETKLNKDENI